MYELCVVSMHTGGWGREILFILSGLYTEFKAILSYTTNHIDQRTALVALV